MWSRGGWREVSVYRVSGGRGRCYDIGNTLHQDKCLLIIQISHTYTWNELKFEIGSTADYDFDLQEADADLEETQDVIERIRKQATRLAQHFCENEKTFNLDEFLSTFRQFCEKVKACQQVCLRVTLLYLYFGR